MDFKSWLFSEMPITKFQLMGNWDDDKRKYGWSQVDKGILTNPKGVEKIHKKWSNTKENFDLYFVKSRQAYKFQEVGQVDEKWVQENLGISIQPNPNSITVIFTNNVAADKIEMTAWTIAHRFGHTLRRGNDNFEHYFYNEIKKDFTELLKIVYGRNWDRYDNYYHHLRYDNRRPVISKERAIENDIVSLAYAVATMKSARNRNLRNFNEFVFELLSQYIITGKIKFNPIPKELVYRRRMAWGHPADQKYYSKVGEEELKEYNELLQGYAEKYEYYLDSIFSGLIGHMFVM